MVINLELKGLLPAGMHTCALRIMAVILALDRQINR